MPLDDMTPESSPATAAVAEKPANTDARAESSPASDATADSSPAKDVSLLDAVKAAIKPKTEGSSPSSKDAQGTVPAEDGEPEPTADPTQEELARYHSKTRRAISRLMSARNEAEAKVKELTPEAEGFRKFVSFVDDSGMSRDEVNLLLDVGRNIKKDPHRALEQIRPYIEKLLSATGEVLPADLKQQIDQGQLTEPHARELARLRSQKAVLENRGRETEEGYRARETQERQRQHVGNVQSAISVWETNQAKSDLDWKLKQERIGELMELEVRRSGFPQTTQDAVALADKALKRVNEELTRFAPRKMANTPFTPAGTPRQTTPKPTSSLEAARLALAR